MAHSEEEFKHESIQNTDAVIRYLDALIDGFQKSKIVLGNHEKQLLFSPEGLIKLEIKGKSKSESERIHLKFSWRETPTHINLKETLIIL